jgi:dihydroxyacetone kinase-like protein
MLVMEFVCADDIKMILAALAKEMNENRDFLIELDSVIGDGDLGLTMSKGFAAMVESIQDVNETDVGQLLIKAGLVMAQAVPSTMGTLIATGFIKGGQAVKNQTKMELKDWAVFMKAFVEGIMARGKAKLGEKTIIDSLFPAAEALQKAADAGQRLSQAMAAAHEAASAGLEQTRNLISQHGKAAAFREKTLGKQDPGATVGVLMFKALMNNLP